MRTLVVATAMCIAVAACDPANSRISGPTFDLEEATIAELQYRMETGRDTSRSLVEKYLARIEAIDRSGPTLRSVIETNPDALRLADELDAERKAKGRRGPLHGVPILIKDNIATADRMMTTAGSLALEGSIAPGDATVVKRLRDAGAVILGKANLSEWANFRSTHSSSGWSGRGGQTRNPYALDRNPSGSSSGSAVAVAANLVSLAIGTETDGSIVSPSSVNGLVGIKPTLGLVSRHGIIPIAMSQDTAGPMARNVADAAVLLEIIAGVDAADDATALAPVGLKVEYSRSLLPDGLAGARLGLVRRSGPGVSPAVDAVMDAAIADLKRLGAVVTEVGGLPGDDALESSEREVLLYEFKAGLAKYLTWLGPTAPAHSIDEIIAFNKQHRDREMPFFDQDLLERASAKGSLNDPAYRAALATSRQLARAKGLDAALKSQRLDALVTLTSGPAWLTDPIHGDHVTWSSSTLPAIAGYPHVTVPAGQVAGLPVGLSFIGGAWTEGTLLKFAYAYEQATRHRRPPLFAATAALPSSARR